MKEKRKELKNKVDQKVKSCVQDLKGLLEIQDTDAKAKEVAKVFSDSIEPLVKQFGDKRKAALEKAVKARVAAILEKADKDENGQLDFEGKVAATHIVFGSHHALMS